MKQSENACANGTVGYDLASGRTYVVKNACKNVRRSGHIYCDRCRAETGGYIRTTQAPR